MNSNCPDLPKRIPTALSEALILAYKQAVADALAKAKEAKALKDAEKTKKAPKKVAESASAESASAESASAGKPAKAKKERVIDNRPIKEFGLHRGTPKTPGIGNTAIIGLPAQGKSCFIKLLIAIYTWLRRERSPYLFPADTQTKDCVIPKDSIIIATGQILKALQGLGWIKGIHTSICLLGTGNDEDTVEEVLKAVNNGIKATPQSDRPNYWVGTDAMLEAIKEAQAANYVAHALRTVEQAKDFLLKFFGIDATLDQVETVLTDVRLTELYTGLLLAKPAKGNNNWHVPMFEEIRAHMDKLLGVAPITELHYGIEHSDAADSANSADSASAGP